MGSAELVQVCSLLVFSLLLFAFLCKANQIKKKIWRRKERHVKYVRTKEIVEEYLNETGREGQTSRFENIVKLTKSVIFHRLKNSGIKHCCFPQKVCKDERSLKFLLVDILIAIREKGTNEKYLYKALCYLLKSRIMKHPFDLVGSRRSFVLIEVLNGLFKKDYRIEDLQTSLLGTDSVVEVENPCYWNSSHLKLFLVSSCYVCLTFFPFYIFDWASDFLLLISNHEFSVDVESALSGNVTLADIAGISRKSFLNSIPWDIASFLLAFSTIITITKLRHLRDLIHIRCIMKDPQMEKADVQVNIETVVKRHDASVIESITESAVQVIFQWGSFMGLSYLIGRVMHKMNHLACGEEEEFSLTAICLLKDSVAFRSNLSLWISGLGSIISLTMAQLKSHNVQHEFCTTWKMKAAYACAALMNTLSYIYLCVSCFTGALDFNNLIMNELDAQGHNPTVLDVYRSSLAVIFILMFCIISLLARFLIFKKKSAILGQSASDYTINLGGNCSCFERFTCMHSLLNNMTNFLKNALKFLNLPTSQFSYKEEYFCYQSMISMEYINFFMVQSLLYIFFMMFNIIFIGINVIILFIKQTDSTFPPNLAPSMVSISRQNFANHSSLVIPFGWFLSYFFLWIYFKLDKGFFSGTNMRFKYDDYKTGENISGVWEDLNEWKEEEEEEEGNETVQLFESNISNQKSNNVNQMS